MLNKAITLKGYKLDSLDGEFGEVKEFNFDHWTIRYLVANTGSWLTGRQVPISPYAPVRSYRRVIALVCTALLGLAATPLQAATKDEPTNADLKSAVDSKLLWDSSVPFNEIDVITDDGIVMLSGTAPNLLAKERATLIAEAVKGVRAVVNNITVKPVVRTNEEVRNDVEAALLADPATNSYEVKTAVNDGVVTLAGTVQSWQEKQLSATVAKGVKGVKEVKNDIVISYNPYKGGRSDSEIAPEIKETLKNDVWVGALIVHASVKDGVVTLTGTVGSAAEKTRAVSDSWTAGVKSVDASGLKVEPWAKESMKKQNKFTKKSDDEIRKAVKDAFLFDPRVFSFNPTVTVQAGVVTLAGTVGNLKAKRAAEQDAMNTVGVWRVKNLLRVRGENPPPDDKLAQNVKDALTRDPYVDRYQIGVSALRGVVHFTGTVDSHYEKTHAEDVASRVNGVTAVNNNLVVSHPAYGYYSWPYTNYHYEPYFYHWPHYGKTLPHKSDAEIQAEIGSQLFWSPFVDRDEVNISVKGGVATLTGTVERWSEYNSAEENAWEGGARDVINDLKVK